MQPHSSHLLPLTSNSVKRLRRGLFARHAAVPIYLVYAHLRHSTGTETPFCGLFKPYAIQNNPLSSLKMVVLSRFSIQNGSDGTFFHVWQSLIIFTYNIYSHLQSLTPQPITPTYTLTPPLKGVSVSGGEGEIHD
jgi:hypothetical protein